MNLREDIKTLSAVHALPIQQGFIHQTIQRSRLHASLMGIPVKFVNQVNSIQFFILKYTFKSVSSNKLQTTKFQSQTKDSE